jgi:signal transduction histidine kinase
MLREWLSASAERKDEVLRQELQAEARQGLKLIGAVAMVLPGVFALGRLTVIPLRAAAVTAAIGAATLALAYTRWSRTRARLLAMLSIWALAATLAGLADIRPTAAYVLFVLGLMAAAVPVRPLDMLALGLIVELTWLASCVLVRGGCEPGEHLLLFAIVLGSTALAAYSYARHLRAYRVRRQALQAQEYLATAQTRVMLAEHAASLGRLMATLAHELNSPLGALVSGAETLIAVSARQAAAAPEKRERLAALGQELAGSIRSSVERLQRIVSRIERLSALHESEFQSLDLNVLLHDLGSVLETETSRKVAVEFDLNPLPKLIGQPQQLHAVFSNLLTNAVNAMNGQGTLRISTRYADSRAEIRIQDSGRGIPQEELAGIFEPGFKVSDGRVAGGGNWSLFSSRQIVHGHGGEMYITSTVGKGSTVVITLPV